MSILNGTVTIAASGAAQTLSGVSGSIADPIYDITLTAACALTLSGSSTGRLQTVTAILRQDTTGGRAVTLPLAAWPNGSTPTLNTTVGKYDVLQFSTVDGSNWFGSVVSLGVQTPTKPSAPSVTATAGIAQNVLTVTDGAANGSAITSRNMYRGTTAGGEVLIGAVTLAANGTYTDMGLTNGTTYYYQFTDVNGVGEGPRSTEVSATPAAASAHYLSFPGTSGQLTSTPTNANSPGYFADMIVAVNMASLPPATTGFLTTSGTTTFLLYMTTSGALGINYTTTGGTSVGIPTSSSVIPSALLGTKFYLRWVVNSASSTITEGGGTWTNGTVYYQYSTDGANWTSLGTAATNGSLGVPTGNYQFGAVLGSSYFKGNLYNIIIRDTNGKVCANPDFTAQATGTTSFTDTAATVNTWTITSPASET